MKECGTFHLDPWRNIYIISTGSFCQLLPTAFKWMHFNHTAGSKIHFPYVLDLTNIGAGIILSGEFTDFLILESSLDKLTGNFLPYFCLDTSLILNSQYKTYVFLDFHPGGTR